MASPLAWNASPDFIKTSTSVAGFIPTRNSGVFGARTNLFTSHGANDGNQTVIRVHAMAQTKGKS